MAYKDIFGKEVDKYWKYEGNNKRMQKYHKIAKILEKINCIIKWIAFSYFLLLATLMLINLIQGEVASDIINKPKLDLIIDIVRAYMTAVIGGQWLYLVNCLFKIESHSYEEYTKRAIIAMPLAFLITLYCRSHSSVAIILFVICAMYMIITYSNIIIIKEVKYLYGIATGKAKLRDEENKESNEEIKEITEEVQVVKEEKYNKNKKEKRRK